MEQDLFGATHIEESDEESDSLSGSDQEDAAVADTKQPSDTKPQSTVVTTEEEENPTDEFLKSSGKFSFGSHDANETDVSDLFIPDEAKKLDDLDLFVSKDDPDLLE